MFLFFSYVWQLPCVHQASIAPLVHLASMRHWWLFFCFLPTYVQFSNCNLMFSIFLWLHKSFIICCKKFMVCFNFSFCNLDDQINPSQIIKCEWARKIILSYLLLKSMSLLKVFTRFSNVSRMSNFLQVTFYLWKQRWYWKTCELGLWFI